MNTLKDISDIAYKNALADSRFVEVRQMCMLHEFGYTVQALTKDGIVYNMAFTIYTTKAAGTQCPA